MAYDGARLGWHIDASCVATCFDSRCDYAYPERPSCPPPKCWFCLTVGQQTELKRIPERVVYTWYLWYRYSYLVLIALRYLRYLVLVTLRTAVTARSAVRYRFASGALS